MKVLGDGRGRKGNDHNRKTKVLKRSLKVKSWVEGFWGGV